MIKPINYFNKISFKSNKDFEFNSRKYTTQQPLADTFVKKAGRIHLSPSSPNTEFLYDIKIPYEDRLEMAKERPELLQMREIEQRNGLSTGILNASKFFSWDCLRHINRPTIEFLDISNEINAKNLKRILENKDSLMTKDEYKRAYKLTKEKLSGLVRKGGVKFFELYAQASGELEKSPIIYINKNESNTAFNNAKKIGKRTKFYDEITKFEDKPVLANVGILSKLGFGDVKTLYMLLKTGKLDGRINKIIVDGITKYVPFVELTSRKSEKLLKALRAKNCMDFEFADNRFGLTYQELEDAYLDGMLDCYTEAVFIGDLNKIFIDLKSKKNVDSFNQLLFQKEILYGLDSRNFKKATTNQRIKLAWYLAPKTRDTAQKLASNDTVIQTIIRKKRKQDTASSFSDRILSGNYDNTESTRAEKTALKAFYQKLWETVGFDEFNEAITASQKTLDFIQQNGINSVADKTEKDIICNAQRSADRDFLKYMKLK